MDIEFNQAKNEKNIRERGLSFELAINFEIDTALIEADCRHNYDELRFNALGLIDDRLYHMTYTLRSNIIRVIRAFAKLIKER